MKAYDDFINSKIALSKEIPEHKEISQFVLLLKSAVFLKAENIEGCKTGEMSFGFNEKLVNEMLQYTYDYAYNKALKSISEDEKYRQGYDDAYQEVKEKLGFIGQNDD